MSNASLSEIHLYPIKSTAGLRISRSRVQADGLPFDRRFVLSDPDGRFVTARECPALLAIRSYLRPDGLTLQAPDGDCIELSLADLQTNYQAVTVWGDRVDGQRLPARIDAWFSAKLGRPLQLLYFGNESKRFTALQPDKPVAFADGYPLLLISDASLAELNRRSSQPSRMDQFRPNLVVSADTPFIEDGWRRIRIGSVEFEIIKPCSRCVMTTYDPVSGQPLPAEEPLATLRRFRRGEDGEVYFGQNLIPLNEGTIAEGDEIEVLESQPTPRYRQLPQADEKRQFQIRFAGSDQQFTADNQQPLLAQAEANGIELPFSCRAGRCGRCKIQLRDGDVQQLSRQPLSDAEQRDGLILACSAIPLSDLLLELP
ncbi:YcbX family protein [Marinobacterium arenosum]|uniref:YcbX family protein n=1 Tax=Marinobacterium arenosum TaxID=2862496 RepID=UPI001C9829ED|nr:YcbX family protein [Marinobacterium arenosum]MBY4678509.1 YcbX family protein [Marinobacterium arenosum]